MKAIIIFIILVFGTFVYARCDQSNSQEYMTGKYDTQYRSSIDGNSQFGKPYIGINCLNTSQNDVKIVAVTPNSPADAATLKCGDRITSINDTKICNAKCFIRLVKSLKIDEVIFIKILRNDKQLLIPLRVGSVTA